MKQKEIMTKIGNQCSYEDTKKEILNHQERIYLNFEDKFRIIDGYEEDIEDLCLAFYCLLLPHREDIDLVNHIIDPCRKSSNKKSYSDQIYSKAHDIVNYLIDLRMVSAIISEESLGEVIFVLTNHTFDSDENEEMNIIQISVIVNTILNL